MPRSLASPLSPEAQALRAWAKAQRLTYAQLAVRWGVHPVTVARWMSGRRRVPGTVLALISEQKKAKISP